MVPAVEENSVDIEPIKVPLPAGSSVSVTVSVSPVVVFSRVAEIVKGAPIMRVPSPISESVIVISTGSVTSIVVEARLNCAVVGVIDDTFDLGAPVLLIWSS